MEDDKSLNNSVVDRTPVSEFAIVQDNANFPIATFMTLILMILTSIASYFHTFSLPILLFQAFLSIVAFYLGRNIFIDSINSFRRKQIPIDLLVVLGVIIAFFFSLYSLFVDLFNGLSSNPAFYIPGYVILFIIIGRYIESKIRTRSHEQISITLSSLNARLLVDGKEVLTPVSKLKKGSLIRIKPGDEIPVDGIIHVGSSRIDESLITGVSGAVKRLKGDEVFAGTHNKTGMFIMKAYAPKNNLYHRIGSFTHKSCNTIAPVQRVINNLLPFFIITTLFIASATFFLWLYIPGENSLFTLSLSVSLAVLLVVSTRSFSKASTSVLTSAISAAANRGILFSSVQSLQESSSLEAIAFTKNGVLTTRKPVVSYVKAYHDIGEESMLRYAASLESASVHSIARAITSYAEDRKINFSEPRSFESLLGLGIKGKVEGRKIVIGNLALFRQEGIGLYDLRERIPVLAEKGLSPVLIAIEGRLAGLIGISYPIKDTAKTAINNLNSLGLQTIMITGDGEEVSKVIAKQLGINVVRAGLSPEDKISELKKLRKKRSIALVAEKNDLLLSNADIGVVVGVGAELDLDDDMINLVLIKDDLSNVPYAIQLSTSSMSLVKQNIVWASAYNLLAIPIAAGVLYPEFGLLMSPVFAGLAMVLSSIVVSVNSIRLSKD